MAKKYLGQHFIMDHQITDMIAQSAGNISNYNILEIGPGLGTLTESILNLKPKKLVAIEKDFELIPKHNDIKKKYGNKYTLIHGDALTIQEENIIEPPVKIIANLPYNISTVLLFKWLEKPNIFESMILMFQKEVADRIIAKPGNKSYGILSIITQVLCNIEKICDLGPEVFYPPPKVHSSVIKITPLSQPRYNVEINTLKKILNIAFSQRRKTIANVLKSYISESQNLLLKLNIDCKTRPENISIEQYCQLANLAS